MIIHWKSALPCLLLATGSAAAWQEAGVPAPGAAAAKTQQLYGKPIVLSDCPIQPLNDVKVPVQQPGVLVDFPVKEGLRVKKGDRLGRIEDGLAKIELEAKTLAATSEAGVRAAMAAEEDAQAKLASAKVLHDKRAMSDEQYNETKAALQIAKERVNDARSKHDQDVVEMKAAAERLRLHTISSPIDGVVVEKFKQEGESVQIQDPTICRLIRTDIVKVKAQVNIRDARLLRKGMSVEVFPNRPTGERQLLLAHTGPVTAVKALSDGLHCLSSGEDGQILLWNLQKGDLENILASGDKAVNGLALSPANPNVFVSVDADKKITVWDWKTGKATKTVATNTDRPITAVALHPRDPNICILGDESGNISVWNLKTDEKIHSSTIHSGAVTSIAVTPDGKIAVSAANEKSVRIWDVDTGKVIRSLRGRNDDVKQLGLSADGRIGLFNNLALLQAFSVPDGKLVANMESGGGRFSDVAVFSPVDPRLILAGNESKQLQLWQYRKDGLFPRLIRTFSGNLAQVRAVDFTPDGSFVISGGADRSVRVFEVPDVKEIAKEHKLGKIEFINDHVEGGSNTVAVSIEVGNADNVLLSGSFATVIIYPEEPAPAVKN